MTDSAMLHRLSLAMCIAASFYMLGVMKRPPVQVECQAYKFPEFFDPASLRGSLPDSETEPTYP